MTPILYIRKVRTYDNVVVILILGTIFSARPESESRHRGSTVLAPNCDRRCLFTRGQYLGFQTHSLVSTQHTQLSVTATTQKKRWTGRHRDKEVIMRLREKRKEERTEAAEVPIWSERIVTAVPEVQDFFSPQPHAELALSFLSGLLNKRPKVPN